MTDSWLRSVTHDAMASRMVWSAVLAVSLTGPPVVRLSRPGCVRPACAACRWIVSCTASRSLTGAGAAGRGCGGRWCRSLVGLLLVGGGPGVQCVTERISDDHRRRRAECRGDAHWLAVDAVGQRFAGCEACGESVGLVLSLLCADAGGGDRVAHGVRVHFAAPLADVVGVPFYLVGVVVVSHGVPPGRPRTQRLPARGRP